MRPITAATLSAMALFSILITGCGGGGGAGAAPAAAKIVTGVAATGAPVSGQVYLADSSAPPQNLTARTASDGSFAFNVEGLTPPYIIKATYTDANGGHNLYSLASDAGITNITPLTTIVVAQAVAGSNLDTFFTNHTSADLAAASAKMPLALKDLQAALSPLMAQYGVTGFDVLHGRFDANHTGIDAMMDAVKVAVTNGAVTITAKAGNTTLFTAQAKNIAAGTLTMPMNQAPVTPMSSGATLYTSKCAGCHGDIASSNLIGRASAANAQSAITANLGGMAALTAISITDLQNIIDALTVTVPVTNPAPATPVTPSGTNTSGGAALYAANCAGCHGALASSRKSGATVVRTQNAISGNIGGMGSLSALSAADIQTIVTALNPVVSTPAPVPSPTPSPTPTPTPVCGSCHAIPPANGRHSTHRSKNVACVTCHGSGYSTTSVNATTHNNGIKNVASTIGWNATSRTCANSCHGSKSW